MRLVWRAALLLAAAGPWSAAQDTSTQSGSLPAVRPVRGDLLHWRASEGKAAPLAKETRIAPADRLGTRDGDYAVLTTESGTIVSLRGVRTAAERMSPVAGRASQLIEERVMAEIEAGFREETDRKGKKPAQLTSGEPPTHGSVADEIAKLRKLRDEGALTEEQYAKALDRTIAGSG